MVLNKMKKKNTHILLLLILISSGCKTKELHILIPQNYEGWVRVVFAEDTSSNHVIKMNDFYQIHVLGNSQITYVKEPFNGTFNVSYFYYSKDTLFQIGSAGNASSYPDYPNVTNDGTWGEDTYAFYVSRDSTSISKYDSLSELLKPEIYRRSGK
jgi:hypothetical protein